MLSRFLAILQCVLTEMLYYIEMLRQISVCCPRAQAKGQPGGLYRKVFPNILSYSNAMDHKGLAPGQLREDNLSP